MDVEEGALCTGFDTRRAAVAIAAVPIRRARCDERRESILESSGVALAHPNQAAVHEDNFSAFVQIPETGRQTVRRPSPKRQKAKTEPFRNFLHKHFTSKKWRDRRLLTRRSPEKIGCGAFSSHAKTRGRFDYESVTWTYQHLANLHVHHLEFTGGIQPINDSNIGCLSCFETMEMTRFVRGC